MKTNIVIENFLLSLCTKRSRQKLLKLLFLYDSAYQYCQSDSCEPSISPSTLSFVLYYCNGSGAEPAFSVFMFADHPVQ